jgi:amino acid transporter
VVIVLITLISVGSTSAFFAILSLNTLALYISYLIPMIFFTLAKLRGDHIPYGPFKMGRYALAVNVFAIVYAIFIIIWLPFPATIPVTAKGMNYGGPVVGMVILFALADWNISGKKRFKGPVDRHQIELEEKDEANE